VERQAPRGCHRKRKSCPISESFVVGVLYAGLGILPAEFRLVDSSVAGEAPFDSAPWSKSFRATFTDFSLSQAFRNLNSVTVPKIISVPKNKEEDAARGN